MKNFLMSYLEAFLYGRGLMRFHQGKFEDAARLFEKVCRLEDTQERKELSYSYYGRSLLKIGKSKEAVEILSKAYELINERNQDFENEFELKEFQSFIKDYLEALNATGQVDRATEIKARGKRGLLE
jgi:tetratricopeptide (TPR) repeat protein